MGAKACVAPAAVSKTWDLAVSGSPGSLFSCAIIFIIMIITISMDSFSIKWVSKWDQKVRRVGLPAGCSGWFYGADQ